MDALHFLAGVVAASLIWSAALLGIVHREGARVLPALEPGRRVAFRGGLRLRGGLRRGLHWFVVTTVHSHHGEVTVELTDQDTFERYGY